MHSLSQKHGISVTFIEQKVYFRKHFNACKKKTLFDSKKMFGWRNVNIRRFAFPTIWKSSSRSRVQLRAFMTQKSALWYQTGQQRGFNSLFNCKALTTLVRTQLYCFLQVLSRFRGGKVMFGLPLKLFTLRGSCPSCLPSSAALVSVRG